MKAALQIAGVALLLGAIGCKAPSYLTVTVVNDTGLSIVSLELTASDGVRQVTAQAPATSGSVALAFPATYVISAPSASRFVQAEVTGLAADGTAVGRGETQVAPLSAGGFPQGLTVVLTTACSSVQDCDPAAVCAGTAACVFDGNGGADAGAGRCLAVDGGQPLAAGSACGPLGVCDAGSCLGPFCGDGVLEVDAGEQCDNGTLNSDLEPFACRSNCQLYHCGDGVVDRGPGPDGGQVGERCDLGSLNGLGQGCNRTCSLTGATTLVAGFPDQPGWNDAQVFDNGGNSLFEQPYGLAVAYPLLYVADLSNSAVRLVDFDAGQVYTLAGGPTAAPRTVDGTGLDAGFYLPTSLALVAPGTLLVGEGGAVRALRLGSRAVTTLVGTACSGATHNTCMGNAAGSFDAGASFTQLTGFAFDPGADTLYASEASFASGPSGIRELSLSTQFAGVAQLAGGPQNPTGIAIVDGGALFAIDEQTNQLWQLGPDAGTAVNVTPQLLPVPGLLADAGLSFAGFSGALGMCTDGTSLFVMDTGNSTVWQVDPATLAVSLVAGGGTASFATTTYGVGLKARFEQPYACTYDAATGSLFVSDGTAEVIFQIQ